MSKKIAGPEIERLIQLLSRLPGLGPRSARKAVLSLLKRRTDMLVPLSEALALAVEKNFAMSAVRQPRYRFAVQPVPGYPPRSLFDYRRRRSR